MTRNQKDENQSPGPPNGFAPISVKSPILQLCSKGHFTLHGVFDASSPTCSSHSLLKDVTEAMDDTRTLQSLAALLGTEYHFLESDQVAQLSSVRGGKNCVIKVASTKGSKKKKWCCQM